MMKGAGWARKEAMLERLQMGDEEAARARVAAQAIPARAVPARVRGKNGQFSHSAGRHYGSRGGAHADYLTARIARDRPDIWERMKNGEFTSVAAAGS
jgi:hypothetical protein